MVISKKSSQMIYHEEDCPYAKRMDKKYKRNISERHALERGYHACSYCGGLHGFYVQHANEPSDVSMFYDRKDKALCFRTDVGFWKVIAHGIPETYRLWHLNGNDFNKNVESKFLMRRTFHRQVDVKATLNIGKIIQYIRDHDKAKKIIKDDWKKLPKSTSKQKKYYEQAKKKAKRREHRRLDELFKKLEKGEL